MQTNFPPALLADPAMAASEAVIRKCVHCGFCTATCPTYVLLGDELDSPRGRIYLMKDMLENEREPTAEVIKHIDRCLSCLSCMTTCPSGVNYMHLVDHARAYIEERYRRPWRERLIRALLAHVLPFPGRFRLALRLARLAKPATPLFDRWTSLKPLAAMLALTPAHALPRSAAKASPARTPRGRVALLRGCAEPVLRPEIGEAAVRVLNRAGFDVLFARGEACCGALVHHMGREAASLEAARRNIDAYMREIDDGGLDAIVITASGCGTTIKDYGFMLRNDPAYADKAARISALAKDISELLADSEPPAGNGRGLTVAYHAACSLQHGQKVTDAPRRLLESVGYTVRTPKEAHLCCGSAGTYNILQPDIAGQLGDRKAANLARLDADLIATGNIGCAVQIGQRAATPVVHTIELIDWATGGPCPRALTPFHERKSA
ncbi:glycolate oxidase subunit GlcF [Sphingomonas sp. KC8]|uniref:glycolate oxidase subunit GlcF n=1 Tax=Sphingomonas sp. KC8 TaxID=1030157 RepID=UPI000248A768|nr:glycolate oxidase subunit GlcF [Sphingomonas sp. KC8]ARS28850.1 2-hydroxy-acid oxidase [Sphingomonas sp. KC8]